MEEKPLLFSFVARKYVKRIDLFNVLLLDDTDRYSKRNTYNASKMYPKNVNNWSKCISKEPISDKMYPKNVQNVFKERWNVLKMYRKSDQNVFQNWQNVSEKWTKMYPKGTKMYPNVQIFKKYWYHFSQNHYFCQNGPKMTQNTSKALQSKNSDSGLFSC